MAAASTLQYNRQKKSVYGKASKSTWSATNFFDNSDDELAGSTTATPAKGATQRSASVKSVYPVQKAEVKKASPAKGTRAKKDKQDTFDVPSSDEEQWPLERVVRKPLFQSKRPLVDDTVDAAGSLPSWEHKRARITPPGNNTSRRRDVEVSAKQLSSDLAETVNTAGKSRNRPSPPDAAQKPLSPSPGKVSGAAARLAARKRVAENLGQSATAATDGEKNASSSTTPRKRARTAELPSQDSEDVVMADDASLPSCDNGPDRERNAGEERDIYDFPDSSADESAKPRQTTRSPKSVKKLSRRTKPATQKARAAAVKGTSAPARLAEMLPTDSEATEPSTASPSESVSRASTPRHPSTPPSNKMSSPGATVKRQGTLTPKQAQLWERLLPTQPAAPSPSALAMKDLTISGRNMRTAERSSKTQRTTSSQPDMPKRRTRLVDRLKASAESSSEDESSGSSSESESEDAEEASNAVQSKPPLLRAESTQSRMDVTSNSQSQSRSQHAVSTTTGFKRTYASQRSYLAEDNLEDDIMAGILDDTPKQPAVKPKVYGRSASNTKKDAFDMDDSDDAAAGGGLRSVHELRAAGRHIRGAEDIEQLLEDIENHSPSHKSRRRSALMDIATKLADKSFASRFIGQGCDVRLAKQWDSSQDDIASFVLAASIVMMLASDPPEHTLRTLQDSNAMPWLATLLTTTREVSKMAKERQYNMAKASQASLIQVADLVRSQTSLWNDASPSTISTRLVALKGLDMLVGKLRRAGEKSELLAANQLPRILQLNTTPSPDAELETSLGISILESLSTTSLALTWDAELLQRISQMLVSSDTHTPQRRHTFFLALRLTLNLTTDNPRNADTLATAPSVPDLLQTVLSGFRTLEASAHSDNDDEARTLALDILVLALGILINVFEHSATARAHAAANPAALDALVATFVAGQHRLADAEDLAASISNVALGYLAVALANLCQSPPARALVCGALPGASLELLGDSVEEFVRFHAQVDGLAGASGADVSFGGEEGREVWGGFTERLRGVLERVRGMQEGVGAMAG